MHETSRLKQLKDQIVGIEMNLTLLKSDLSAIDGDIVFLEDLVVMMKENIEILKQDGIVAVASQYKMATIELKTAQSNLDYYLDMRVQVVRSYEKHTKMKIDSLLEYEVLKKHVDARKVVLMFDPTRRKK